MFLRRRLLSTAAAAAAAAARGSPPIRVSLTESMGRGVFATRPVSSGELLHSAQPLVAHPSPSLLHKVCYNCLRRSKPGGGYAPTGDVYFCSEGCWDHAKGFHHIDRSIDWSLFDRLCSSRGVNNQYMPKRLACMVISGAAKADCLNELQPAQLPEQTLVEMKEEFELFEFAFRKAGFQEDKTYYWYINVWATIRLNAFGIVYGDPLSQLAASVSSDSSVGDAVYMLPSFYNHDCDPNAHIVTLDSADIKLKACRDIEEGEELRICYINPCLDADARQKILAYGFGFQCRCLRCLSGDY